MPALIFPPRHGPIGSDQTPAARRVIQTRRNRRIERELTATRKELHELKQQLADLLEFFSAMTGAIKVFNWVGKLARPAAAIVAFGAACVTAWSAWRGLR